MKMKYIFIAITSAIISVSTFFSASTLAHGPSVIPDREIWISGSSIQDKAIGVLFSDLCDSGTLDIFKDNASPSKPGQAHSAYFCTLSPANVSGLPAAQKVLLHKRSLGGSYEGIHPVADGMAIDAMVIDNGNCAETSVGSQDWLCTISNPGDLQNKVSDAGISNVEPALFIGLNVKPSGVPVTPIQLSRINVTPMVAVIYGVPVTKNLRDALQEVQGLVVGDEAEANMPSLTKIQVSSIISGAVRTWDQFLIDNGGTKVGLASFPFVTASAPTFEGPLSKPYVYICRRVPGSGTQAQMNAKFNNSPCAAGANPTAQDFSHSHFFGPIIVENNGSGDVSTCLNNADTAGKWALGVQSLEKGANASGLTDQFRFVKIDGVAPFLENVAANKYFDWAEVTMQWRKPSAPVPGPSGDILIILKTIAQSASNPARVAAFNAGFSHPFQVNPGAYLALSGNGYVPSFPFDPSNPVAAATHAFSGIPSTCSVPLMSGESDL